LEFGGVILLRIVAAGRGLAAAQALTAIIVQDNDFGFGSAEVDAGSHHFCSMAAIMPSASACPTVDSNQGRSQNDMNQSS
jgi:hypothetical protein